MRLIKFNRGGGFARLPINLDDRFVLAVLALVCLGSGWGPNIYQTEGFVLVISVLGALAFSIPDRLVASFGAYLCVGYMTLFILQAFNITNTEPAVIANSLHISTVAMTVYILTRFGTTSEKRHLDAICAISCVLAVLGLAGAVRGREVVATLGNQNFLGAFLAIGAFSCIRPQRWGWLFLILPALWFCRTTAAIASFLAGLGFMAWRWKGLVLSAIPAVAYFLLIKRSSTSIMQRLDFWTDCWEKITSSWWTVIVGFGPGIPWRTDNTLHSVYADILWNLGIIGLIFTAVYIRRSFRIAANRRIAAMITAACVDGIGNHLTQTIPTACLAAIIFALNDRNLQEA